MHIADILATRRTAVSFEFFPPRNAEGAARLDETIASLAAFDPAFVSVTYGAGGGTRDRTHALVSKLRETTRLHTIPHLTCAGHSREEIDAILARYAADGIDTILALRGDPPRNAANASRPFAYADELVRTIRAFPHPTEPRGFGIGVAAFPEGHPDSRNRLLEMDHLKAKVDAGADYICTQFFFDNRDFHDLCERCELAGIHIPILAGILPIASVESLHRMADLAPRSRVPARLLRAIQHAGDSPDEVRRIGIAHATDQCADLLEQRVAGLHFYTLNQASPTREILRALNLSPPMQCT